jgi:mannose-6-phosphate isomerase-like protein (cupin superfamily)
VSDFLLTERRTLLEGPLGAVLLLPSAATNGQVAVVEHPLAPRALGALVHTHRNEDEYSLVLEGRIGVEIGGETLEAGPGDVVVKPRGIPHAFWNPTGEPARVLELIVPGGFEAYFAELAAIFSRPGPPDLAAIGAVAARYELELDPGSIPRLAEAHGLDVAGPP